MSERDIDLMAWAVMKEQATMLVKSGFLPKAVDTPEKAMAIAMKGRELGLPMMQSITSIYVVDGKPTISAELMAALVYQRIPGAVLRCIETSNTICTYEAGRPGDKRLRLSFTWGDAVKAGVTHKDNWKKYPAAMLRARCCSAICRIVFPDAIMGCYTPDELGAITNEEGAIEEVIDISTHEEGAIEEVIDISTQKPIAPPQAKTPPPSQRPEMVKAKIEKTSSKEGSKAGKKWTLYGIQADGVWYNTFDKKLFDIAEKQKGKQAVEITFEKTERGNNLVSIQFEGCTANPATCDLSTWEEVDGVNTPLCESGEVCRFREATK